MGCSKSLTPLRLQGLRLRYTEKSLHPLIFSPICPSTHLFKRGDSGSYEVQNQYWVLEVQTWVRCCFLGVVHDHVRRQDIQIVSCRRVHLIIEDMTDQLGMQWGGGRVSRDVFTKQKMFELVFDGYVGVYQVDSGGREFQAEGTACTKSVSEVRNT